MCGIFFYKGRAVNIETLKAHSRRLIHRGPDNQHEHLEMCDRTRYFFGFNRLSMMGLNESANQPMIRDQVVLICNGEIYNCQTIAEDLHEPLTTGSDCEAILSSYFHRGLSQTVSHLDGEYAFVLVDFRQRPPLLMVARDDRVGVRPLFWGAPTGPESLHEIAFASEGKALVGLCSWIKQFPPRHYYLQQGNSRQLVSWRTPIPKHLTVHPSLTWDQACQMVRTQLILEVRRRLMSDREIGVFLSGGVDSSLIASILVNEMSHIYPKNSIVSDRRVKSFSIGVDQSSPDLKMARVVAEFLGTDHHEVIFTPEEGIQALDTLIYHLESWDITTIRASLPMYLLSRYIKTETEVTAMLSGEGPDEAFGGYLYLHQAPDSQEFQDETERLVDELMYFDVLRGDRATAAWSLEVRLPYLGREFLEMVLSLPVWFKDPRFHNGIEKNLLRSAFAPQDSQHQHTGDDPKMWLPDQILWRPKDAFSDGVGRSWKRSLEEFASQQIPDELFDRRTQIYPRNTPPSKEAMYYRQLFEQHYPGYDDLIPHYWMPRWTLEHGADPSATALKIYQKRHSA